MLAREKDRFHSDLLVIVLSMEMMPALKLFLLTLACYCIESSIQTGRRFVNQRPPFYPVERFSNLKHHPLNPWGRPRKVLPFQSRCLYNRRALVSAEDRFLTCVTYCPIGSTRKYSSTWGTHCKKEVTPKGCEDKRCYSCSKGYLSKTTYAPYRRTCVKDCGNGYYQVRGTSKCHTCTSNCDVCERFGWRCNKCSLGYSLHEIYRGYGRCWWSGCPAGYNSVYNRRTGKRVCSKKPGFSTKAPLKTTTTKIPITKKVTTTVEAVTTTAIPTTTPDGCIGRRCLRCLRGYKRKTTFPYKVQCVKNCGKGFYEKKGSSVCHRCHGHCSNCTDIPRYIGQKCNECNIGYTWKQQSRWWGSCRWTGCPKGYIKRRNIFKGGWKCIEKVTTTPKPCEETTTTAITPNTTTTVTTPTTNATTKVVKTTTAATTTQEILTTDNVIIVNTTKNPETIPTQKTEASKQNVTENLETTMAVITPPIDLTTEKEDKEVVIDSTISPSTKASDNKTVITDETFIITTPEEETVVTTLDIRITNPNTTTSLQLLKKENEANTTKKAIIIGKNPVPEGCLDSKCMFCKAGYTKYLPVNGVDLCVTKCPPGYSAFAGICLACSDRRCGSCTSSIGECDRCMKGYAMLMDATNTSVECVKKCPKNHKLVQEDNRLLCLKKPEPACPIENCDVCIRSSLHFLHVGCDKCNPGFYLYRGTFKDTCRKDCPSGYFKDTRPDSTVKACNKCETPLCHSCDAANLCTKCISPFVLDYTTLRCGLCPPGTVFDFIEEKCIRPRESLTDVVEVIDEFISSNGGPGDGPAV